MGRQKSEPFWQHHVEAWRASDLTQEQYGRRHGLSATALAKWSSRLQREARAKRRQALVPVHVVGELAPASAMV
ncbi:IS66 family insertion sequence element accessory protein TnpA, partial [Tahibacter caeni]|uniref:IS66 family insertion sequence element accessory protein TnpA n=1 Tax=Tahibacter caeni TaxID=1453545 RepID=UPI0021498C5F